jgi:hypothetical protein
MREPADRGRIHWLQRGAAAALAALLVAYGFFMHRNHIFPYDIAHRAFAKLRFFSRDRLPLANRGDALDSLAAVDKVARIPYLQGYRPASGRGGVRVYDSAIAQDGWKLFTSGHATVAMHME